jgi:hypothetical protein
MRFILHIKFRIIHNQATTTASTRNLYFANTNDMGSGVVLGGFGEPMRDLIVSNIPKFCHKRS